MAVRDIPVLGGSACGLEAVLSVVGGLPPDYPAAVFVVIHYLANSPSALHRTQRRHAVLPAELRRTVHQSFAGRIYVARPGFHLARPVDGGPPGRRGPLHSAAAFSEQAVDAEHQVSVIRTALQPGRRDGGADAMTIATVSA